MENAAKIYLKFAGDVRSTVRARILYAFRVFAAIYNYGVVEKQDAQNVFCFVYGENPLTARGSQCFHIPARYEPTENWTRKGTMAKHLYAGEKVPLFFGIDPATGNPDWLGEIFEWISSSHETCITERDAIGRIAYKDMIFSGQKLSPRKPYATLMMAWLENTLRRAQKEELPRANSPISGTDHAVICSQDIDFYSVRMNSTLARIVKNLGISALQTQSWSLFKSNLALLGKTLIGKSTGEFLPAMIEKMGTMGIRSTLFVIPRQGHRRDSNYQLGQLAPQLAMASKKGFPAELHGSYTSIIEEERLADELATLETVTQTKAFGNRLHWLRFGEHEKLFDAVQEAGLVFDSTLGFSEMVGFRNGASFAFPPYNFKEEKPYEFLEIPLVLMDRGLEVASSTCSANPQELAEEVLEQSRKWSWGGISLLWHNPLEPLHVPKEINRVFWECARAKDRFGEKWMSADQFVAQSLERYQSAGLLREVNLPRLA